MQECIGGREGVHQNGDWVRGAGVYRGVIDRGAPGFRGKESGVQEGIWGIQGCTRAWEVSQGFTRVYGGRVRGAPGYMGI